MSSMDYDGSQRVFASMNRLVASLKLVADGLTDAAASDYPAEKYDEFQALVESLSEAKALGLVYEVAIQRSMLRATYNHAVRVLVAGGLTPAGKQWLSDYAEEQERKKIRDAQRTAQIPSVKQEPEVFQLKPTIWGMGVDLKALWRKFRARRSGDA